MTPLPTRLRESAQKMRGLFLVSENVPNVRMIYKEDRDRIAAELTEAADALEAGPWMPIETAPKDKALLTHDGVSYNLAHFNTALGKWIANHPYDERLPREPIRWTLLPPHPRSGTAARVAQEGGGVSASAYLAKVEADPRRAAALQRARDRAADGVATRHPRCGYPYCACVGQCFAASQPGAAAGVEGTKNG